MSDLQETLQELTEDVENIVNEDTDVIKDLANEEIKTSTSNILNKYVLSEEDIKTFNSILNFNLYLNELNKVNKLSSSQAFEAFTMLPPMIELEVNKSKYTSSPTSLNKKLFEDDTKKIKTELNAKLVKLYEKLNDFRDFYSKFKALSDEKNTSYDIGYKDLKNTFDFISEKLTELNKNINSSKIIVIFNNKTYNLFLDPIDTLKDIEDDKIFFKPYENKLSNLLFTLHKELKDENLIYLFNINIFSCLQDIISSIAKVKTLFDNTIQKLDAIILNIDNLTEKQLIDSTDEFNCGINMLQKLIEFYKSLNKNENIFKCIEDIVELTAN